MPQSRARRIGRFALALALASPGVCLAQSAPLSWACWIDAGDRLNCLLESMPVAVSTPLSFDVLSAGRSDALASPSASALPVIATSGTALGRPGASPRALPPIVARLREQPQSLAGQVITIPLYTVTDDWPRVTLLARALLCTSAQPCEIRLSHSLNEALSKGLDVERLFVGPDLGGPGSPGVWREAGLR